MIAKKDMNQKRSQFGITYDDTNKEVYVFGGDDGDAVLNHCEKYSVDNDEWTILRPFNNSKACVSACMLHHKFIYIIGGYGHDSLCTNHIDQYVIENNTWETIQLLELLPTRCNSFIF